MSKDSISYEDLIQIVQLVESSSHYSEFHLKVGDIEIDLRAKNDARPGRTIQGEVTPEAATRVGELSRDGAVAAIPTIPAAAPADQFSQGSVLVRSPMVGTFYRAPEPGAQPFVAVGSRVQPDTTICIIEVMKLMSSIPAEHHGVVTQILADDAQLVEAAQVLMVIEPAERPQNA